jgi:pyruvate/2-oxoglutarate dehydrogenase complex dihydrolipoamide dehydrogenase (E3) component
MYDSVKRGSDWRAARIKMRRDVETASQSAHTAVHEKSNVDVINGVAKCNGSTSIECDGVKYTCDTIVIAVGTSPRLFEPMISSAHFFRMNIRQPKSAFVYGGGYVAAEIANILHAYNVDTIWAMRSYPLKSIDSTCSAYIFKAYGGVVMYSTQLLQCTKSGGMYRVYYKHSGGVYSTTVELAIYAAGESPNTSDLGIPEKYLDPDGYVKTDSDFKMMNNVYALGDCSKRYHNDKVVPTIHSQTYAKYYGIRIGRSISKIDLPHPSPLEMTSIYTFPEYSHWSNPRSVPNSSLSHDSSSGLIKIQCSQNNIVSDIFMVGLHASDILSMLTFCSPNLSLEQITNCPTLHPTISEIFYSLAVRMLNDTTPSHTAKRTVPNRSKRTRAQPKRTPPSSTVPSSAKRRNLSPTHRSVPNRTVKAIGC